MSELRQRTQAPPDGGSDDEKKRIEEEKKKHLDMVEEERINREKPYRDAEMAKAPPAPIRLLSCIIRFLGVLAYLSYSCPGMWIVYWLPPLLNKLGLALGMKHGNLPGETFQRYWMRGMLNVAGVTVEIDGTENVDMDRPTVFMMNHGSNLDPPIGVCHNKKYAYYIYKRELHKSFFWFAYYIKAQGHIPIDRSNREDAIASLNKAVEMMTSQKKSVTIFPEGQRSRTGKLQVFKKGGFHMAKACPPEFTLVPCVVRGSWELWPTGQFLPDPGTVTLTLLPPIKRTNEKGEKYSPDELADLVQEAMLKGLNRPPRYRRHEGAGMMGGIISIIVAFAIFYCGHKLFF